MVTFVDTLSKLTDPERAHIQPLGVAVGPEIVAVLQQVTGIRQTLHPTILADGQYHFWNGANGQPCYVPAHRVEELLAGRPVRRKVE